MATKHNKSNPSIIDATSKKVMQFSTKANDLALTATEKVITTSFGLSEKCLIMSGKVIKRGLQLSAMQQNMVFNALDSAKGKFTKKAK